MAGHVNSPVATATYVISGVAGSMPTFNLSREIYLARHSATFNNSMVDKTFNHSTNGSIFLSTRFTASNEEPAGCLTTLAES